LIVWLVTALATFTLPLIFLRDKVQKNRGDKNVGDVSL